MTHRAFAGLAMLVAIGVLGAPVSAHLAVSRTAPADGATVAASPAHVRVWFTQPPSDRLSRLELHGPSGEVELSPVQVNREDRSISAAVTGSLARGAYEVRWRTAGNDGHVMRGCFSFTVEPKP